MNFFDAPEAALTVITSFAVPFLSAVILTFLADFLILISFFPDLILTFTDLTFEPGAFALNVTLFFTFNEEAFLPESETAALESAPESPLPIPGVLLSVLPELF